MKYPIISMERLRKRNSILLFLETFMTYCLMGVLLASFHEEIFKHERPCPLCYLQRFAFLGTAMGALMNIRFGFKTKYVAFALLFSVFGNVVSTRQILLHICPGFPKFGYPVFGYSLYTWAYAIFAFVVFTQIILLFWTHPKLQEIPRNSLNWWEKGAFLLVLLCLLGNIASTFFQCGFHYCEDTPWPEVKSEIRSQKSEVP